MKYLKTVILTLLLSLLVCGCSNVTITTTGTPSSGSGGTSSGSTTGAEPNWGVQAKTAGCRVHNALPDTACTPGAVIATATKSVICRSGYAGSVRNVPTSEKNQDYKEYGVYSHAAGQYEVDHLVSLELGGSNAIANLWPEAASPKPGFHEKDKVENYLHSQVCYGTVSLKQAQIEISTNWLAVYNQMPKK
jgi:hypothetical protein